MTIQHRGENLAVQEHVIVQEIPQVPNVERIQEQIVDVTGLVNPHFSITGVEFSAPQAVGAPRTTKSTAAPAYPLKTALQSAKHPEHSHLVFSQRPRVHADPRRLWPALRRTHFLFECRKLVRCLLSALGQLCLHFSVLAVVNCCCIVLMATSAIAVQLRSRGVENEVRSDTTHFFSLHTESAPLPC